LIGSCAGEELGVIRSAGLSGHTGFELFPLPPDIHMMPTYDRKNFGLYVLTLLTRPIARQLPALFVSIQACLPASSPLCIFAPGVMLCDVGRCPRVAFVRFRRTEYSAIIPRLLRTHLPMHFPANNGLVSPPKHSAELSPCTPRPASAQPADGSPPPPPPPLMLCVCVCARRKPEGKGREGRVVIAVPVEAR
jgi:hypothetical protein